jgi:hypothetical protein
MDAEKNLELRVLQERVGSDGLVETGFAAVNRFEYGDRKTGRLEGCPTANQCCDQRQ